MRFLAGVVLTVGLCVLAGSGARAGAKADNLDGTWIPTSLEVDGKKAPAEALKNLKLVIKGTKFTLHIDGKTLNGSYKADPSKTPKTIDATFEDPAGKTAAVVLAIYELKGDTFRVCGAAPDKARPKEFASKPGEGHELVVYKRQKP
ncbi:MAG TPA: TIGR03067 domain-containing protein [Gemmataceae bacterium]|nr:TIGR03067 domain-containing protein [Gemmataceae bacterium]